MSKAEFDLCVIGGGAAGLVVAAGGSTLGAKVMLIEKQALGGDCLHYGCVPSKTLLHSAKIAQTMREAARYGIAQGSPQVDIASVMEHVNDVVNTIGVHDSPERFRALGVEITFGEGRFVSPDAFEVNGRSITARHFVIATGSRPAIPPIDGLGTIPYMTNETVFSLREPVPSLAILGGGPIGIEMAQAFNRLGSRVTVIEMNPQILPREDREVAEIVRRRLHNEGVVFYPGCRVTRATKNDALIQLTLASAQQADLTLEATHALVATGRRPNIEALGLPAAGVETTNGQLVTDKRLRTTNKRIFACGDVVGPYLFTHMAEHHAGVVLRNTIFRLPAKIEERVIPWCTFTDPELARVGLSENEARKQQLDHRVYTFPFKDIDRAQADGETDGLAKIITDRRGKLLGACLVGPHAGELIHEYTLALANGMKAADLSKVIHIYPTLAQINRRVADMRMKEGLTPSRKKWIKRIFGLRGC